MKLSILIPFILLLFHTHLYPQDPTRFAEEIKAIGLKNSLKTDTSNLIVFTGSSSLRRWDNLSEYFPSKNIINTAFGGSQMSDLLYYSDTLIIKYRPVQVFIYEGDNDLASGKEPEEIIKDAEDLLSKIRKALPSTEILIISAKPSPLRWDLKDHYLKLNRLFRHLEAEHKYLRYIDLWSPLIGASGRPRGDLFIKDSLHINNDGYKILAEEIRKFIR